MSDGSKEFQIRILTPAELGGAIALEQQLQRDIGRAKALGKEFKDLESQLKQVQSSIAASSHQESFLGKLKGQIGEVAEKVPALDGITGFFGKLSGGAIGAAVAGIGLLTAAVAKFSRSELKDTALQTALANIGQLTDENIAKLDEQNKRMREQTGEDFKPVLTHLLQFGSNPDSIGKDATAVENLAGVLGGPDSLAEAASLVGKALQGNFTQLAKLGIVVPQHASQIEKLNYAYNEFALRGGGQLAAANNTLAGQWKHLSEGSGSLLKSVGGLAVDVLHLRNVMFDLGESAKWVSGLISQPTKALDGLKNAARATTFEDEAVSAEEYAKSILRIKTNIDEVNSSYAKEIEMIQAVSDEQDKTADVEMALELQRLKIRQRNNPNATRVQNLAEETSVRNRFRDDRYARSQATIQARIDVRNTAISRGDERENGLSSKIAEQEKMVEGAKASELLRRLKEGVKDRQKQFDRALEAIDIHKHDPGNDGRLADLKEADIQRKRALSNYESRPEIAQIRSLPRSPQSVQAEEKRLRQLQDQQKELHETNLKARSDYESGNQRDEMLKAEEQKRHGFEIQTENLKDLEAISKASSDDKISKDKAEINRLQAQLESSILTAKKRREITQKINALELEVLDLGKVGKNASEALEIEAQKAKAEADKRKAYSDAYAEYLKNGGTPPVAPYAASAPVKRSRPLPPPVQIKPSPPVVPGAPTPDQQRDIDAANADAAAARANQITPPNSPSGLTPQQRSDIDASNAEIEAARARQEQQRRINSTGKAAVEGINALGEATGDALEAILAATTDNAREIKRLTSVVKNLRT